METLIFFSGIFALLWAIYFAVLYARMQVSVSTKPKMKLILAIVTFIFGIILGFIMLIPLFTLLCIFAPGACLGKEMMTRLKSSGSGDRLLKEFRVSSIGLFVFQVVVFLCRFLV